MNKKAWLDYLYYKKNRQQDFLLCGLRKQGDKVIATKWKKYSQVCFPIDFNEDWKITWVNQRQILPCEVVVDLEEKEKLEPALKKLRELGAEVYAYNTGSRGYHLDIFFDKELTPDKKLRLIRALGGDEQKASEKTMIALEFCPHWKSGKMKELVEWN